MRIRDKIITAACLARDAMGMRIRDKIITAGCLTRDGIEWTSLNIKQEETELVGHGSLPMELPEGGNAAEAAAPLSSGRESPCSIVQSW